MGLDLSMTVVPIEMENIFSKAIEKSESEYPSIIFSLPRAFEDDFCHYGHPDWIEFKRDAQKLLEHYPNKKFEKKYYFDSKRKYGAIDYLISRHIKDHNYTFFNTGIEFKESVGVQGRTLKYWDKKILSAKSKLIEHLEPDDLMKHYDFPKMDKAGVYKISQIDSNKKYIEEVFVNLKSFLKQAIKVNGYILITKD